MRGVLILALTLFFSSPATLKAHCEIPCGIYGDGARIGQMLEDLQTIEKSMKQIDVAQGQQMVRWVMNKEEHASRIQETVSQYWLHQRIKPVLVGAQGHQRYLQQLAMLHQIAVHAMKAKQSTEVAHVLSMRKLIATFVDSYFEAEEAKHLREDYGL